MGRSSWVLRALLCSLACVSSMQAQLVKGSVRDAETKEVVRNAFVALLDTGATMVVGVAVDGRGRFSLAVPQSGVFAVVAMKDGYQRQVSQWLEITPNDTFELTVRMARFSTTLAPVVIEAERDSLRRRGVFGLSANAIGGTIVTPSEIAVAAQTASSAYDVVESLNVPTLAVRTIYVEVPQKGLLPGLYRCISYRRTGGCVTIVIDGQRYSDTSDLLALEGRLGAQDIAYMVFLRPNEADTLYGSETKHGVLVVVRKTSH